MLDYCDPILDVEEAIKFLNAQNSGSSKGAWFYRGHSNVIYDLNPAVYRNSEYIEKEDYCYREMLARHPNDFVQCRTTFDRLTIMQHYGLPTRLLDITFNPLVALYFACRIIDKNDKDKDADGHFIAFCVDKGYVKHVESDTVSVLANLARMESGFNVSNCVNISDWREDNKLALHRLGHEIRDEKPYFKDIIDPSHLNNEVICVRPRWNNPRIIAQQGAFLLYGMRLQKKNASDFSTKNTRVITVVRAIIPKEKKDIILQQLRILGISEETLFPEMEVTAKFLKGPKIF